MNQLDSLPPEIGMLLQMKTFYLFDNNIETLPNEMGSMHKLQVLGIEGNPLNEELKSILAESGTKELIRFLREQAPSMLTSFRYNSYVACLLTEESSRATQRSTVGCTRRYTISGRRR